MHDPKLPESKIPQIRVRTARDLEPDLESRISRMVRSHTSKVAYPDFSEYAEQLQAFTTRLFTQRRVSALPLNPAALV